MMQWSQNKFRGEKMKILLIVLIVVMVLFTVGCDTELGHHHDEDHDHDGDGIPDHAPEDHRHTENKENHHIEKAD